MPRMGDLAATDVYSAFDVPLEQSTNVGWANRMGEILTARPQYDESTIYQTASPLVNISEGDIGRATEAAMGVSGGGMMVKPIKPLPEKQFYNQYSQHVDLRNRGNAAAADEIQRRIMEEGFRQSGNVNTLPAYRGGPPANIVDMKLAPKSGDTVYLVPNTATTDMGNGLVINKGWRPEAHEILKIAEDYPSLYKEYLKAWESGGGSGSGGGGGGIRAYHSSPHDFDKFDLAKIGTGEGAQVYGHGLYFAENPAVSGQGGQYWNQFLRKFKGPEEAAASKLRASKFDREAAINDSAWNIGQLKDYLTNLGEGKDYGQRLYRENYAKLLAEREAEHALLTSGKPVGPRTYEVSINADPAHMLDWDKPLKEQAPHVRDVLRAKNGPFLDQGNAGSNWNAPGSQYYRFRTSPGMRNPAQLSEQLSREYGIPGIKYLDQGSRASGTGSSNYVIFDPGIIDIMKKYGIAGAAPVGMGVLAAQDRYQQ